MTDTNTENPAPEPATELVERVKRPTRTDDSFKAVIDELQATSTFLQFRRSLSFRRLVRPARLEDDLWTNFVQLYSG